MVGRDGKAVPVSGDVHHRQPDNAVNGRFQLTDGQTVGVAAPIILQFDAPIDDDKADRRAGADRHHRPARPRAAGRGCPTRSAGSRVHWRTREYFPPGTKVHVDAKIYGVPFGDGAYGADRSRRWTSTSDAARWSRPRPRRTASRWSPTPGVIMDFPCSYGEGDLPRNVTRSGIHVVTEKYEDFYMSNPAAGYNNVHERWAVRISNNGEFIHANPASSGAQGNTNVTNGCINLSDRRRRAVLQHRDLRRPGRGHRHLDPAVLRRRRHLGLGGRLGRVDVDVGAVGDSRRPSNIPSSAPATPTDAPTLSGTPDHRRRRPRRRRSASPGG